MYCDEVCDCTGTHARTHTGAEVVEVVGEYIYIQNSMLLQSNKIIIYKLQRGVLCLVVVTVHSYGTWKNIMSGCEREDATQHAAIFSRIPVRFGGCGTNLKTFENTK